MKIEDLRHTCEACPSQWEGMYEGRTVYVRYRWGNLTVSVGPVGDVWGRDGMSKAVCGIDVFRESIGNGFDGEIEWDAVEPLLSAIDVDAEIRKIIDATPFADETGFWFWRSTR